MHLPRRGATRAALGTSVAIAIAGAAAWSAAASPAQPHHLSGAQLNSTCVPTHAHPVTAGKPALSGWELTLPVSKSGSTSGNDAATVKPAKFVKPYLTQGAHGALDFYAPSIGATTPHSLHARTELVQLGGWTLGDAGTHTLTATVSVSQVPTDTHNIIVGQIHGGGADSSVPLVMLHYRGGTIDVLVERGKGQPVEDCTLLRNVALNQPFSYQLTAYGSTMVFAASTNEHGTLVSRATTYTVPTVDIGYPVRFQAGDYQQSAIRAANDAGRVTFTGLSVNAKR
jgi:hypothetical protein